jgi:acyl carrier protein
LAELDPAARERAMVGVLSELLCSIVGLSVEKIDASHPLTNMGMNSLMFMDLQMAIEKKLGIKIPILELMKGSNLTQLATHLLGKLKVSQPDKNRTEDLVANKPLTVEDPQALLARLESLTDDEVDRLLSGEGI